MKPISASDPRRSSTLAPVLGSPCLVLAACGGSSSSTKSPPSIASPPSTASASAPPTLAALISRSAGEKINSMSFTLNSTVPAVGGTAASTLMGVATLQLHPSLAGKLDFTAGGRATTERFVGSSIYTELPQIAARDGGRPWVVVNATDASAAVCFNYSQLLQQAERLDPTKSLSSSPPSGASTSPDRRRSTDSG